MRLCVLILATLSSMNLTSAAEHDPAYIWGRDQHGLIAGARVLSATGKLQPGDPIVVEFVLKNTSDEEKTIVINGHSDTYPTLGSGNRIELNILSNSQQRNQYKLEPGETLKKRQYRVTVSTEGLPPGDYNITANSAFWLRKDKNSGTGVGHGKPIPVNIGGDKPALTLPKEVDDPAVKIHWGKPTAGLILGARFPMGKASWVNGDDIETELFLFNVSDEPIKVELEFPPSPADWNVHLTHESGNYVRLNSTWRSGMSPTVRRLVTLDPHQQIKVTGIESDISTGGGKPSKHLIPNPAIRLLAEKTEPLPGHPKQLIGGEGKYEFHTSITARRSALHDITTVISAAPVPLTVNEKK